MLGDQKKSACFPISISLEARDPFWGGKDVHIHLKALHGEKEDAHVCHAHMPMFPLTLESGCTRSAQGYRASGFQSEPPLAHTPGDTGQCWQTSLIVTQTEVGCVCAI